MTIIFSPPVSNIHKPVEIFIECTDRDYFGRIGMAKCRKGLELGQNINAVAIAAANVLSQSFSNEELELLAAFFTVLGDALITVPAASALCEKAEEKTIGL